MDLADEEVTVGRRHLGVRDVDHVVVDIEVELRAALECALEPRRALRPHNVLHLVLEAHEVHSQLLDVLVHLVVTLLTIHERGQLRQRQRCVQLQVASNKHSLRTSCIALTFTARLLAKPTAIHGES